MALFCVGVVAWSAAAASGSLAGAGVGAAAGACLARLVSMLRGACLTEATAASAIDSATKAIARIVVERVRKSAAPRADISPDGLPPMPSPPPSERCMRMTPTSAAAISAWRTRRKVNIWIPV